MASRDAAEQCPEGPSFRAQRFAAQFVVWATRIWVAAVKRRESPSPMLDQAFAAAGAAPALAHLNGLLRTVATAAARPIDVRCPSCAHVSPDELALVQMLAAFQRDAFADAAMLLSDWLPPAAVRVAIDQAWALALALGEAELTLTTSATPSEGPPGTTVQPLRLH